MPFKTKGSAGSTPVPSSSWSSFAGPWALIAAAAVLATLAAAAWAYRRRGPAGAIGRSVEEEQIEVLEMEPVRPPTSVKCPACGTRVAIYEPGPQRIQCPGCGTKGVYRPNR
jgi:ribosomal protein S27E